MNFMVLLTKIRGGTTPVYFPVSLIKPVYEQQKEKKETIYQKTLFLFPLLPNALHITLHATTEDPTRDKQFILC